jgi:hypothetical protein
MIGKKMTSENYKIAFMKAAADWVCDLYAITVRYIVIKQSGENHLTTATIVLNPLPGDECSTFEIDANGLTVGNYVHNSYSKKKLLGILEQASQGILEIPGKNYLLSNGQSCDFYSEMTIRDRWYSDLHLQVSGTQSAVLLTTNFTDIDNQLRRSDPPFDGLEDVANWLGLTAPVSLNNASAMKIRVSPPVDVIYDASGISDNELTIIIHAHPKFDVTKVGLSVRGVPGNTLTVRKQVTSQIHWNELRTDRREGIVRVSFEQLDSALVMLTIGEMTVRRQWFADPSKARNSRFIAMQMFDKDLRMVRQALEQQDSVRFEKAVAALAFLLGFASAIQVESDSPDIILTTPGGKVALVECTTRVSDFASKVGKLVDRCRALSKTFESNSHAVTVYGILACGLPRDQIAFRSDEIERHKLILISRDELIEVFDRLRYPNNPDELLESARVRSSDAAQPSGG